MPLTVFDCKGISATRRERIEAAVVAAGQRVAQPYEGWIAADPSRGGVRVAGSAESPLLRAQAWGVLAPSIAILGSRGKS
jgi:hypothetical protein